MKYIIFLLILSSCGYREGQVRVCNCEQQEKVLSFVQNSIKNANNMSDEEMEDVVSQLERTGVRTICGQTRGRFSNNGGAFDWNSVEKDSCKVYYPYSY